MTYETCPWKYVKTSLSARRHVFMNQNDLKEYIKMSPWHYYEIEPADHEKCSKCHTCIVKTSSGCRSCNFTTNMTGMNLTEGHLRNISKKLFKNWASSFWREYFQSVFFSCCHVNWSSTWNIFFYFKTCRNIAVTIAWFWVK